MALRIYTTGLEQYAPGGEAFVKSLVIGGPGVGKTRWSSFFPKPFYANCENGLASVADRRVQAADIKTSQDMLDVLVMLKQEGRMPRAQRRFQTFVVDTLDAFQRKVMDEWLQMHPGESSFSGFEAWGYLNAKMDMLMTRLLNLDMNVIVLVHYTDKTITEGSGANAVTHQEYQLQLSGQIKDKVFNDFDLVGWMGTFYAAEGGQRVQKRGLTFRPTPDKPFLKDRLNCTPSFLEVNFNDDDYAQLFASVISRLDDFTDTEEFGEVPPASGIEAPIIEGSVVGPLHGGALPEISPQEMPLAQFDKPTLTKMARELGFKPAGNLIKSELIAAIEKARAERAAEPAPEVASEAPVAETPTPVAEEPTGAPVAAEDVATDLVASTLDGYVNTKTGEIVAPAPEATEAEAIATVTEALGATVVDITEKNQEPKAAAKPNPTAGQKCENCGLGLEDQDQNLVRLAWIKERRKLCNADFEKVRNK